MRRVLARCCETVVARIAGSKHLGVINGENGCPDIRGMAILADVAGLQMCLGLAGCVGAIVTGRTIAGDIHMIEIRGQPGNGRVAVVTGIAAGYMRGMLAGCRGTIVAGVARTDNLGVINGVGWRPDIRRMTVFANEGGLYMRKSLAGCVGAVVTTRAVAGDACVVKDCR